MEPGLTRRTPNHERTQGSSMNSTFAQKIIGWYDRALHAALHLDGLVSLGLRLILAPVLIGAGWEKLHGENWFTFQLDSFPFPLNILPPGLSWFLASWTEFVGGICLLLGLGTRIWAIMLAVTMFVAAYAVHLPNGWAAITPSMPPEMCMPATRAHADSTVFERYIGCYNINERTIDAAMRLEEIKTIVKVNGDWKYLNGAGSIVKLNNGIEFAAMYFMMLLSLTVIGGGRLLSLDYFANLLLRKKTATILN